MKLVQSIYEKDFNKVIKMILDSKDTTEFPAHRTMDKVTKKMEFELK
jgi:hypothetical protein